MSVISGLYQWLRITPESTATGGAAPNNYGVYNSVGTGATWVRIVGDSAFQPTKTVMTQTIRSADSYNRRIQKAYNAATPKHGVAAALNLPLYPSLAGFFLGAAGTIAGTSPAPNLGSYTFDYFNGYTIRRYLGGMCSSLEIASEAESQMANLTTSWVFQTVDDANPATFPAPAETVFPTESPYVHTEMSGNLKVAASPGTPAIIGLPFDQFHLSIKNTLASGFYDKPYISFCQWAGRDVDLMLHTTVADATWRAYYENVTGLSLTAEFLRSVTPAQNLSFNFETVNYVSDRSEARPLGGVITQGATIQAFYDVANTADFGFTANYATS